jgi:Protein of unknown function (DUF3866)
VLKLRRGVVASEEPLTVEVDGEARPAWADRELVGEMREGDEVVVNTEALDLGLGSGGFDVVHVNLTRGLEAGGDGGAHVMKLNYTSLQHPVEPVEAADEDLAATDTSEMPVLVIPLHGHLAPAAWAASQAAADLKVGYVQSFGGALPGSISRDVATLRDRELLSDHITAGPAYGGGREAMSVVGGIDTGARLGWEAAIVGPGPGIVGSETRYGHGGMAALENAHAALALGLPTLLSVRFSSADARERHAGLSHHTETILELLLVGVEVPVPEGADEIRAALRPFLGGVHHTSAQPADLDGYAASGLPALVMGRGIDDDPPFFAAALAAGSGLAAAARG